MKQKTPMQNLIDKLQDIKDFSMSSDKINVINNTIEFAKSFLED